MNVRGNAELLADLRIQVLNDDTVKGISLWTLRSGIVLVARIFGNVRQFTERGGDGFAGAVADDLEYGLRAGFKLGNGELEIFCAGNFLAVDGNDDVAGFQPAFCRR